MAEKKLKKGPGKGKKKKPASTRGGGETYQNFLSSAELGRSTQQKIKGREKKAQPYGEGNATAYPEKKEKPGK